MELFIGGRGPAAVVAVARNEWNTCGGYGGGAAVDSGSDERMLQGVVERLLLSRNVVGRLLLLERFLLRGVVGGVIGGKMLGVGGLGGVQEGRLRKGDLLKEG